MEYISDLKELKKICDILQNESILGVDLECENGLHHYGTFITLIQVSSKTQDYIIDAFCLNDITPFIEILENPLIVKIFHDISFDFRVLNYQYNCKPKNVFDTQLALQFLGREKLGLKEQLEKYFSIKKEKRFQMADWTRRPLSSSMLSYAVIDSKYLIPLKEKLEQELIEKKYFSYFKEESENVENSTYLLESQTYDSLKGYKMLSDIERGILKELFFLREDIAKKVNKPNYFILNTRKLFEIVKNPLTLKEWENLSQVHPIVRKSFELFYQKQEHGKSNPIPYVKPKTEKLSIEQKQELDNLTALRDKVSSNYSFPSFLIASKDQLRDYILTNNMNIFRKWQRELLSIN